MSSHNSRAECCLFVFLLEIVLERLGNMPKNDTEPGSSSAEVWTFWLPLPLMVSTWEAGKPNMRDVLIFNQQKWTMVFAAHPGLQKSWEWVSRRWRLSTASSIGHPKGPAGHSVDFDSRIPQTEPLCGIKGPPFALTIAAYSRPTNSCSWVGTISEPKVPTHLIVRAQCLPLPSQPIFCFLIALETDSQPFSGMLQLLPLFSKHFVIYTWNLDKGSDSSLGTTLCVVHWLSMGTIHYDCIPFG